MASIKDAKALAFIVPGRAVPQGSKTAFRAKGSGRPIMVDDNAPALHTWRGDVLHFAHEAIAKTGLGPLQNAVQILVYFHFKRPKSHYTAKGDVKLSAPSHHSQTPDVDKLCRALNDALMVAGVIADDKLIAHMDAYKVWDNTDHTAVVIKELEWQET